MSELCDGYEVTDDFFGAPFVDVDEEREEPCAHRYVHGGFEGTATRFALYFPPPDGYGDRFVHCIGGGRGGSELAGAAPVGRFGGGFDLAFGNLAFLVDSNQGHIGADDLCPKGGDDSSIYGYRASAETARFARHAAAHVYGAPPGHGYLFGGSGGANRSIACFERVEGLWDGVVVNSGFGNHRRGFRNSSAVNGAVRALGEKLRDVVDAMDIGGSGRPFVGLTTEQRDRLADVYRLGYPRGGEHALGGDFGIATWTLLAEDLVRREPDYFRAYWSEPGYRGHDGLDAEVFETTTTVTGVHTAGELAERVAGASPMALTWRAPDATVGISVADALPADTMALTVTVLSGQASGRVVQSGGVIGDVLLAAPWQSGDGQALMFGDVVPGDQVKIENRPLLAFCDWYRHHVLDGPGFDFLRMDGAPLYPQHPHVDDPAPQFGEVEVTGRFAGKVIMLNPLHTTPTDRILYERAVRAHFGDASVEHFRMWSIEGGDYTPSPSSTTRYVDYSGVLRIAMTDLIAWVERGTQPPASTVYTYDEFARFALPSDAAERLGVQPVVRMTANGGPRADVAVGEDVVLQIDARTPPAAGMIVAASCDFDGSVSWPHVENVEPAASVAFTVTHRYDRAGIYFPAVVVSAHRDGDATDSDRHVQNLSRARVVVT